MNRRIPQLPWESIWIGDADANRLDAQEPQGWINYRGIDGSF